jgi:hypothetical protein
MNRGIIEAAVTDKTLRLELEYRWLTTVQDGMARTEDARTVSGLAAPNVITEVRSGLFANWA